MTHHSIRLYPFDTEENDDEEIQLNESIRVRWFRLCESKPLTDRRYLEHDPFRGRRI